MAAQSKLCIARAATPYDNHKDCNKDHKEVPTSDDNENAVGAGDDVKESESKQKLMISEEKPNGVAANGHV